jgi:hypothetical protein
MTKYVTNKLRFKTNVKTILVHLQSKAQGEACPPQFSLNSIRMSPRQLQLSLTPEILALSALNAKRPSLEGRSTLDPETSRVVVDNLYFGKSEKSSTEEVAAEIQRLRVSLSEQSQEESRQELFDGKTGVTLFNQSIANYEQYGFFSQYDWQLTHWGSSEDIISVVPETFVEPTVCLEFESAWAPPVASLQELANIFPSVRFRLNYRYTDANSWELIEFFSMVPWGY